MMKKCLVIIVLSFFSLSSWAQFTGDTWAKVKSSKSGTISIAWVKTPGLVYIDKSGALTGVCIEIMSDFVNYVNTSYGVKLSAKYVGKGDSFTNMYNNVKQSTGGVIGVSNVTILESRKSEIKFSPPYINNFAILVSPSNVPTLSHINEISTKFDGLIGYAPKGTTNEKRLLDVKGKYFNNMQIKFSGTSAEIMEIIIAEKKGFTFIDLAFYLDAVKHRQPVKRHPVGDQKKEQYGFIMPLDSDWQPVMEEFFAANGGYTKSIRYKKILAKHLGDTGVKLLIQKR